MTERSAAALLMSEMRELIDAEKLDIGKPDVETISDDRKMPDIVLYRSQRSRSILCLIEAKHPVESIVDNFALKDEARAKATQRHAPYFALTNFRDLTLYDTVACNELRTLEEQEIASFHLCDILSIDELKTEKISNEVRNALTGFLRFIYFLSTGQQAGARRSIDQLLIDRLQNKIARLSQYYAGATSERYAREPEFASRLQEWFMVQGWTFYGGTHKDDFVKAARQAAYLIINKILFYDLVQSKRPTLFEPLNLEAGKDVEIFRKKLYVYFDALASAEYEIFSKATLLDEIAFPNIPEIIDEFIDLIGLLQRYDLAHIGYDVIGRLFERLIPPVERHKLGQFFTSPDVVDLILAFTLRHENDRVLDPSCGAGTFLVRAYEQKKSLNPSLTHGQILDKIRGVDVADFPAQLARINLAIRDLSDENHSPQITCADFLAEPVVDAGSLSAIVGNPPYTRQEEIGDAAAMTSEQAKRYKAALQERVSNPSKHAGDLSDRAGLHAYFLLYCLNQLCDGARLGFVMPDAWLETEYGRQVQQQILRTSKILAIIGSKVERWFPDADVSTCIVLLEKCSAIEERDSNPARFVYLRRKLSEFLPAISDIPQNRINRAQKINAFKSSILERFSSYENEMFTITVAQQKELANSVDRNVTWGGRLRSGAIYERLTTIVQGGGFSTLGGKSGLATVRFGVKSGANDFFYLTAEQIEKAELEPEFFKPIAFSLKEFPGYRVDESLLRRYALICDRPKDKLKGTNLLRYINRAESEGLNKRPTCASRSPWYSIARGWKSAPLLFPSKIGERMPILHNDVALEDKKFYGIVPKKQEDTPLIAALLNSTVSRLFVEFGSRQLTGAQAIADVDVIVAERIPLPSLTKIDETQKWRLIRAYEHLTKTRCESLFKEFGGETGADIVLSGIKPELRQLDSIVMGEIWGLADSEQLDVYRALVDHVRARLNKAGSAAGASARSKIDIDSIAQVYYDKVKIALGGALLQDYYIANIAPHSTTWRSYYLDPTKEWSKRETLFGWAVASPDQQIECDSEAQADLLTALLYFRLHTQVVPLSAAETERLAIDLVAMAQAYDTEIGRALTGIRDPRTLKNIESKLRHLVIKGLPV